MVRKFNIPALLVLCLLILTSCTLPLFGATPTVQIPPPATQSSTSSSAETSTATFPIETAIVTVTSQPSATNTSQPVPTNTTQPILVNTPALQWSLIGVGCLTTTTIEITLSDGVPTIGISGVCAGTLPCTTASAINYSCQLVPHKDGQAYCQGLAPESGSALTACMQIPGNTQPVCNTFPDFQRYLGACTCPRLYSDATSCNTDKNCKWDTVGLTCKKKP
jgi:hypothetical protein